MATTTMNSIPSYLDLTGKTALVTGCGSSSGIGFNCAKVLGELGANIVITSTTDRIHTRCQDLVALGLRVASFVATDLADEDICLQLVRFAHDQFGCIHILVNNAGMTSLYKGLEGSGESGDCVSMSLLAWRASHQRNLDTTFIMTKHVLPMMMEAAWGRIINISSTTGNLYNPYLLQSHNNLFQQKGPVMATKNDVAYASAKAAMVGFTRAVALDVARKGITVNAVCPGWIATESQTSFEQQQGTGTCLKKKKHVQPSTLSCSDSDGQEWFVLGSCSHRSQPRYPRCELHNWPDDYC